MIPHALADGMASSAENKNMRNHQRCAHVLPTSRCKTLALCCYSNGARTPSKRVSSHPVCAQNGGHDLTYATPDTCHVIGDLERSSAGIGHRLVIKFWRSPIPRCRRCRPPANVVREPELFRLVVTCPTVRRPSGPPRQLAAAHHDPRRLHPTQRRHPPGGSRVGPRRTPSSESENSRGPSGATPELDLSNAANARVAPTRPDDGLAND